jgi:hypothetical protein
MEHEVIERLAMDAALGELSEDAAALLNAYLAEHHDERQWAERMTTICERTQHALYRKSGSKELPACMTASPRHRQVSIPWAAVTRWAAVVVVSAVIGAGAGRWLKPHPVQSGLNVAVETVGRTVPRSWQEVMSGSTNGFWQAKANAMLQSRPQRAPRSQTNFWETLRQRQSGAQL